MFRYEDETCLPGKYSGSVRSFEWLNTSRNVCFMGETYLSKTESDR